MHALPLVQIDDDLGVVLPPEALQRLQLQAGDELFATIEADGLHLTPHDPELAAELEHGRAIMKERRAVLQALARHEAGDKSC
ncbi:MAG: AbrB/MazE/SpoVT family DNA-binding domain-containing protein [Comamonadaceae bacterium]|nr:AbrB/MazE/SpoVT family DNA-binding domain-containing protein [Burkholderiales bacterium]MEB2348962.1 AbrB/MazE/SpoVT family DNA-binding domain-containing protein [Comamonadaceae bacterium]